VRALAAPSVFEDRATYRLLSADLTGGGLLSLGRGTYFDGINVGAACAHEFAASSGRGRTGTPLRDQIGDPCRLDRRPANVALSCLTLRRDASTGADPWNEVNDFSLWRCLIRECAEELLGRTETYDAPAPGFDYANWEFARTMDEARRERRLRVWCLGLGVDPLTLATDLLVVLVLDSDIYDALFGEIVHSNDEGQMISSGRVGTTPSRVPFSEDSITHCTNDVPIQAAGAAVLRRAWRFREALLPSARGPRLMA
jgi:hypothetical protein